MSYQEKRKYKRFRSKFPVRFKKTDDLSSSNHDLLGYAFNASKNGILLFTEEKIDPETKLELWINIPFKDEVKNLYLKGRVIWTDCSKNGKNANILFKDFNYCCGIQFLKSSTDLSLMSQFIDYWEQII